MDLKSGSLLVVAVLGVFPLVAKGSSSEVNHHPLLPMIHLKPVEDGEKVRIHDVYTRFLVRPARKIAEQNSTDLPSRNYADERRSFLRRALLSNELSRVLSVKLQLRNPDITTITTLAAASYQSDLKKGETWSTEVNNAQYVSPYIRVDNNSLLRVEANLQAASRSSDQLSRGVLTMLSGAVNLISPVGSLVTTLNAERINAAANFSESAMSGLLNDALSERIAHEVPNTLWHCGRVATISGRFPSYRSITGGEISDIGHWDVIADDPVISVFNPVPFPMPGIACAGEGRRTVSPAENPPQNSTSATDESSSTEESLQNKTLLAARHAVRQLLPSDVLHFRLGENTDVYKELVSDPAIAPVISDFNRLEPVSDMAKPKSAAEAQTAYNLCSLIAQKANALGFNRVDAAAIYWAYSFSPNLSQRKGALLRDSSCAMGTLMRELFNIDRVNWSNLAKNAQNDESNVAALTHAQSGNAQLESISSVQEVSQAMEKKE